MPLRSGMSFETVITCFNRDGSVQFEEVTGCIILPLEDAKKDFQNSIRDGPGEFNSEYSGQKYRLELRDDETGEVVDSHEGVVP